VNLERRGVGELSSLLALLTDHVFFLGPACNLYVHDASLVREIIGPHAHAFCKPPFYNTLFDPLVGPTSLLVATPEAHPRVRRIAGAAFLFPAIQSLSPVMAAIAVKWAETLVQVSTPAGEWAEVEMASRASAVTLDIVTRTALASKGAVGTSADDSAIARVGEIASRVVAFQVRALNTGAIFLPGWSSVSLKLRYVGYPYLASASPSIASCPARHPPTCSSRSNRTEITRLTWQSFSACADPLLRMPGELGPVLLAAFWTPSCMPPTLAMLLGLHLHRPPRPCHSSRLLRQPRI
jgi:hypothetical protein